jgi:peptidoglycan/xylan/chitin deacetylase (PgdA/CDA1 family)
MPNTTSNDWIGRDAEFKNYLNSIKNNSKVELAMHGFRHNSNEFKSLTLAQAQDKIARGIKAFNVSLGFVPMTFMPPFDVFNNNTLQACKDNGFTSFSSAFYSDSNAWKQVPAGLLHIPTTVDFYNWDTGKFLSADTIKANCQASLDSYGVCVILIHHWQFSDNGVTINQTTYGRLLDVLNWTKQKEASGVRLLTMQQYRNSQ